MTTGDLGVIQVAGDPGVAALTYKDRVLGGAADLMNF